MSDQKKPPPVPSFEDLQKAAQPDPRLAKTAPHAPNPLLIDQTRTAKPGGPTTPGSRLDPEMLQRLAQSGLAGDPHYGSGANQLPPTEPRPPPQPPAPPGQRPPRLGDHPRRQRVPPPRPSVPERPPLHQHRTEPTPRAE